MTSYTILKTAALGELMLVGRDEKLIGVYFADCKHAPKPKSDWKLNPKQPVLKQAGREILDYLEGERTDFTVPLDFEGTDFQREVWKQIALIPFGETISYTELAQRAGTPTASRAAGTATGKNPISIIVPCHRVVGKNGGLGGYAGRLERKERLLALEGKAGDFELNSAGRLMRFRDEALSTHAVRR